jgi:phosphotriesterase-related protein
VTVVELIARGYIHQLMLSQDACATIDWFEPEQIAQMVPDWNMSFIPAHVLPALKSQGITDEQIQIMMVDNPRRLFEMQGAY